jgi:hypothetical protein
MALVLSLILINLALGFRNRVLIPGCNRATPQGRKLALRPAVESN